MKLIALFSLLFSVNTISANTDYCNKIKNFSITTNQDGSFTLKYQNELGRNSLAIFDNRSSEEMTLMKSDIAVLAEGVINKSFVCLEEQANGKLYILNK